MTFVRTAVAVVAAWAAIGTAPAAAPQPAIELRVRSLNDWLDRGHYLGSLVGEADVAAQGVACVRALVHPKRGLEGIAVDRPLGFYAVVTPDVFDSRLVGMIPLADEDAVLGSLLRLLQLDQIRLVNGCYELRVPGVPVPFYFRSANGYLYLTAVDPAGIDPAELIAPTTFFSDEINAMISLRLNADRIPRELKRTVLGQFELQVEDAKSVDRPDLTPAENALRRLALTGLTDVVALALDGTESVSAEFYVQPEDDTIRMETAIVARAGSDLDRVMRARPDPTIPAAVAALTDKPLATAGVEMSIPAAYRAAFATVVDQMLAESVESVPADERPIVRMLFGAIAPTLRSGRASLGVVASGTDDGRVSELVAAIGVTDGLALIERVKTAARLTPSDRVRIDFDTELIGSTAVYRLTPADPDRLLRDTGSRTVRIGPAETIVLVGLGTPDSLFRRATAVDPKPGRIAFVDADGIAILATALPERSAERTASAKGQALDPARPSTPDGRRIRFELVGGNRPRMTLVVGGRAVAFAAAVYRTAEVAAPTPPK